LIFDNRGPLMFETNSPPRRLAVPLGHKLIAVVIAVAVALGAHAWLSRIAHTTSSAELSFDATAARRIDPGLADAPSPALAIAQSLLTDQVVAGLAKPAHLSSSSIATRIGEFRARLDLTQPSAHVLRVQFRDSDSAKSAATANAVAHTLASGSPLTPPPPASAPTAPPQIAPSQSALLHSAPGPPPATSHIGQSANSLSASLGDLESQLASTDRDLDRLSSPEKRPKGWRRSYAHELPSYTQARERKLLKSAVVTAQAQLNNLRSKYANENPGIQNRLAEIQQQLSAILPRPAPRNIAPARPASMPPVPTPPNSVASASSSLKLSALSKEIARRSNAKKLPLVPHPQLSQDQPQTLPHSRQLLRNNSQRLWSIHNPQQQARRIRLQSRTWQP
jgi:hypothetical protein